MGENRLIQGRYRLLDPIGRGGMGEVWRARDESLGRHVAVKCLKPFGPQHDESFTAMLRERFRREARVAAALQHRGVTVVHDFGESDGVLFLVMELLDGRNLGQVLDDAERRPLSVPDILDIAEQVAVALAHTHAQGIVHRDLKPANIVRLTDGTVKICDFGIARLGDDIGAGSRLTSTGVTMGTPHYMSPEQIAGGEVDQRSDLYSLGCVLYELATGQPPFDLPDAWSILVAHRDTPPAPPRDHRPELPEQLERIVLDLLAKRPDERPSDATELARRIAGCRTVPVDATAQGGGRPGRTPRDPRLPAWTRGMTAGRRAEGAAPGPLTPDPATALTGAWTTGPGAGRTTVPPLASPTPVPSAPSADALTTLAGRHNAGLSLARLGRWDEAGEVHRAVAAERERLLGPDHPDTLASRYEIAFLLSRTGRAAEALHEYDHVARARERLLGPDHPDTLAARQETAYVLGQLGRPLDAHEVYVRVLAARERSMGPDHPDTLRCRHNFALNLARLGRVEDAHRIAREVADARARILGPEHPDTLVTRYEVAYALGRLGRWEEALVTYGQVAEARARVLGPDHPDTLAARYETGISLGRLGRSDQALGVYRELIAARTRVHGPAHPETLRARHGLGVNLGRLGRWAEAVAESHEVAAARARVLGPDHPDTLISRREVAVGLGWLGRWAEALAEYRAVADARARALGPTHPDTLAARNDEAHCLQQLGRGREAAALRRPRAAGGV
ncbi:tetratricopeptide repeat protein [Streptomyces sp. NPDC006610]|uniref:serine/threonine-protein kinase n=1 Tax=Streptomyces sp. NPDC006610 TaxID=3154584 RepID=UPI0033AD1973